MVPIRQALGGSVGLGEQVAGLLDGEVVDGRLLTTAVPEEIK
jgi:hypothetical protein